MKPRNPSGQYDLEALEPRVLLSADGLSAAFGGAASGADEAGSVAAEVIVEEGQNDAVEGADAVLTYDPAEVVDGMFDGVALDAEEAPVASDGDVQTPAAGPELGAAEDEIEEASEPAVAADSDAAALAWQRPIVLTESLTWSDPAPMTLDLADPLTDRMVTTLRAANGPPEPGANSPKWFIGNEEPSIYRSFKAGYDTAGGLLADTHNLHLRPDSPLDPGENGTLVIGETETLSGSGTVNGEVINHGVLSPGNSPGLVIVNGDLDLGTESDPEADAEEAPHNVGTVILEIAGTAGAGVAVGGHDKIEVIGHLTLGGTLQIELLDNFIPELDQQFELFSFDSVSGGFDAIVGGDLGGGLMLQPSLAANSMTLTVVPSDAGLPERPLLFVPGFGGTLAADRTESGMDEWLLNLGPAPENLELEPLTHGYDNLLQSFVNVGFGLGEELTVVLWDYRVPVALDTAAYDGVTELQDGMLSSVSGADLFAEASDNRFDTGLAYLAHFLKVAQDSWTALYGVVPSTVDIVTHSTGGILSRSYIQSAAYGDSYDGSVLPTVNNLVQVGVPNQGAVSTFNMLQNDFSEKSASRLLGLTVGRAYELIQEDPVNHFISRPDGSTITKADLDAQQDPEAWFIREYIGTLQDLLPSYDDAFDDGGALAVLSEANGGIENKLLLDLNFGVDANAWIDLLAGAATIVYSGEVETNERIVSQDGPDISLGAKNEILPLGEYIGSWAADGTVWYSFDESDPQNPEGDGTVPSTSSAGLFVGDGRIDSNLFLVAVRTADFPAELGLPGEAVGHTGLVNNAYSQIQIVEAITGVAPEAADISTDLETSEVLAVPVLITSGLVSVSDFGTELYDDLPDLGSDALETAWDQIDQVIDMAGVALLEVFPDFDLSETIPLPGGAGEIVFGLSPSTGLTLAADLDIEVSDSITLAGLVTFTKPLATDGFGLDAGFFVEVTDGRLRFLGQELSGNFLFEQQVTKSTEFTPVSDDAVLVESPILTLAASDLRLALGDGSTPLLTLFDGSGVFVFTESGFAGEASVSVDVDVSPELDFEGTFMLAVSTIADGVDERVTVGGVAIPILLPASPDAYVRLSGSGVVLAAFGQTITGNFSLEKEGDVIRGGVSGVEVFLGTDAGTDDEKGFRISDGRGAVVIDNNGLALEASGTIALTGIPGVELSAERMSVQVNTGSNRVTESIATGEFDGGAEVVIDLDVAANSFRFSGDDVALMVAGVTISGSFAVERFTENTAALDPVTGDAVLVSSTVTVLAVSGLEMDLGPVMLDGSGVFLITDAGFAGEATVGVG
ncbi:MAG: hypothetical protein ACI9NC_000553, partial [Verrucomicrobiales bacterium]